MIVKCISCENTECSFEVKSTNPRVLEGMPIRCPNNFRCSLWMTAEQLEKAKEKRVEKVKKEKKSVKDAFPSNEPKEKPPVRSVKEALPKQKKKEE